MKLTKDQKLGLDWLNKWVESNEPIATLSGFAGTGKTTLIDSFLKSYTKRVAVTAPTHKAVSVISKILDRTGKTLHSLHGLRPNTNLATFDIDNVQFDPMGKPEIQDYSLIIIDECSMINSGLLALNNERAKLFNVKVLFVGDSYQLPPIGERLSAVFQIDNIFRLTTVVRQAKNNPINTILELVRQDIDNNSTYLAVNHILKNPIAIKELSDGDKHGYALLGKEQFNEKLLIEFPSVFNGKDIRYIAYENENVIEVNNYIRNHLINSSDILTVGDILTANSNTYDEFQSILISNSSDYEVISVEKRDSDYGFEVFIVDLKDLTTNALIPTVRVVNHKSKSWKIYKEILHTFYFNAIQATNKTRGIKWRDYYNFKTKYLQMLKIDFGKRKIVDRDLSYGYAITAHKSQGSSYDISFINMRSLVLQTKWGSDELVFIKNTDRRPFAIEYANKLLYVAISRAKIKNILLWT